MESLTRQHGTIAHWQDDKGFGFIAPKDGGKDVFVHINSFKNRQRRPAAGESVTYSLKMDKDGRPQAADVLYPSEKSAASRSNRNSVLAHSLSLGMLAFVIAAYLIGKVSLVMVGLYVGASAAAFIAYALDKSAARNEQRRTPENTLHLLALIGGWPGALSAQRLFRHKSKKTSFQIVFWITVALNCGALIYLMADDGVLFQSLIQWISAR